MKLESPNDQLMAMAAHRYCLGRQTYMVGACIDWLKEVWPQLDRNSQSVILRDTITAIANDRAGSDFDTKAWLDAASWMFLSVDSDLQGRCRRDVAYTGINVDDLLQ